jgi:acyl carrier protein
MEELIKLLEARNSEIDFRTNKSLIDDGLLTSLDIVFIITEISETFDVIIPPLEITPENFNSAEALYALLTKLTDE